MPDRTLGQRLVDAGFVQGVLIPPLEWSVHFHLDHPMSRIAKTAQKAALLQYDARGRTKDPLPRRGIAHGISRAQDRLVIASQTCDINKDPNEEPNVVALRVFETENEAILKCADTNSTRYFLLDPGRRLVADGTISTLIEKPVLADLSPLPGIPDDNRRYQFAEWLANRSSRPALDDRIVKSVVAPILDNLRKMYSTSDPDFALLDCVNEIRLHRLSGAPPYQVRLLFIVTEEATEDDLTALGRLIARLRTWFDPEEAALISWAPRTLYQISAGNYRDTDKIYLDQYTYRGQTYRGLIPTVRN